MLQIAHPEKGGKKWQLCWQDINRNTRKLAARTFCILKNLLYLNFKKNNKVLELSYSFIVYNSEKNIQMA